MKKFLAVFLAGCLFMTMTAGCSPVTGSSLMQNSGDRTDAARSSNAAASSQAGTSAASAQTGASADPAQGGAAASAQTGASADPAQGGAAASAQTGAAADSAQAGTDAGSDNSNLQTSPAVTDPKPGVYTLALALNQNYVLDIAGGSTADGGNVQIYGYNGSDAQKFTLSLNDDGTWKLLNVHSGKALDVAGASHDKGANIQQYRDNGTEAQRWDISRNGNGSYTLAAAGSGLAADVEQAQAADGTNVRLWSPNGTPAQQFFLVPDGSLSAVENGIYTVSSSLNQEMVLDVEGAKRTNGANIRLWKANGSNAQKFRITCLGSCYYQVTSVKSENVLDVAGAGRNDGANVQQYQWNASDAQQWRIMDLGNGTYSFMSKCSGLYMDAAGGTAASGTNIQTWTGNGTGAQAFTLAKTEKNAETPYDEHGKLHVEGSHLLDSSGNVYQMRGISTHGIAWYPDYVNEDAFATIRDSWRGDAVRLAMYTQEYNGYCSGGNQTELKNLIDRGVQAAADLGMYVIIDWHILSDGNPQTHQSEAIDFFREMSAKYASYGNVLYEICNEPNGGTSWDQIKAYAGAVIPVIRENAPDAVIIVGTPTWSQDVDVAAQSPLTGYGNVMYTLHFYAATHKEWIRKKVTDAVAAGLPIFVTEYGICDASGAGGIDTDSAQTWINLLNENGISFCAWNLSNKNETSALISASCQKTSGWSDSELSSSGQWIVNMMRNE